uniref:Uncharacterized protein n=1 Tax=Arcella intermedia TaxID=1963864 RepID=A0A6B2KZR3_9EUKA
MNFSDTEIVLSIMKEAGYGVTTDSTSADVIFLNTCAIREKAEQRIWQRLTELKHLKSKRKKTKPLTVGVLGCMAERLKEQLLDKEKMVDLVAGPDAYRDIPRLLHTVHTTAAQAINVALSADETYAEISPVRYSGNGISAFVSIMRGCNNMCTYCIVPFTRGRERSRPADSIVAEIEELSRNGIKEVVLLGQNVNSYNDLSGVTDAASLPPAPIAEGFETVYKRPKVGVSFTELVERIARIDPEMRIRFTSPHPKDFPQELIQLIKESVNVCKSIHIPAQSGSTECLARMRRGYSREAYVNLIKNIREVVPEMTLSSDFISGFCGETEEEHLETISLLEEIRFDTAYMFAYSMREKTPAHRKLQDDVPEETKKRRLQEVIDTFHKNAFLKNKGEIGNVHLVLVEGRSRKSAEELKGRADNNKKVIIPDTEAPDLRPAARGGGDAPIPRDMAPTKKIEPGDYVVVEIEQSTGLALKGKPLGITTQGDYWNNKEQWNKWISEKRKK